MYAEAVARGYSFDSAKLARVRSHPQMSVTADQVRYEWEHLMRKLAARSPALHEKWRDQTTPECHAMFLICEGNVEPWERRL